MMKMRPAHWSLRSKILVVLLLLTTVLSSLSFLFINTLGEMDEVSETITEDNLPELLWLSHWETQLRMKEEYVETGVETEFCCSFLDRYDRFRFDGQQSMQRLHGNPPDSLSSFEARVEELDFMILNNVTGLLEINDTEGAADYIENTYTDRLNMIQTELDEARMDVYESLQTEQSRFGAIISRNVDLLMLVTAFVILGALIVSYKLSRSLTRPVEKMESQLRTIASGRYGHTLEEEGQVELQPLIRSINTMSLQLKRSFDIVYSDKQYREQILDSLPIGIVTSDERTGEVDLNAAAESVIGSSFKAEDLPSLQLEAEGKHRFYEMLGSKDFFLNEKVTFPAVDKDHVYLVSQARLADHDDEVIGKVFYFIDITDTEELEQQVRQTEKLAVIGSLAAGAAHEIRNPLAVVDGFLKLMHQSLPDEEQKNFRLELLLKEVDRINAIIEEMLMLAKPAAPALEERALEPVVEEILPLLKEHEELRKIAFHIDLEPVPLHLDAGQMKQVFHNLIRNSAEAMNGEGTIEVTGEKRKHVYCVKIKDNGPGIPEVDQAYMFDPFATTKENGTGLGLTIAERIMDHHQGRLFLQESSKSGTTFCLEFPLKGVRT
ncbi:sensor histidine kinase [Alkalicoccus urumqiensis]|uniref:histidine kinase n=1 Tax=Alkalicoccus urumqiensis TaxID=1548213 RepID=A0A2P6ML63_ALKUR|nr:ATP-binding protein [Alkalicoccus urumqiensis]PRO67026.1 two-component sensor histidine kinase [Alkalicoccus urumqiensis]